MGHNVGMSALRAPLRDAFGTRLDPLRLLDGVEAQGVGRASLSLSDEGLLIRCERVDDDAARARALTFVRSLLSPLVSCRLEGDFDPSAARVVDERRTLPVHVALAEVFEPARFATAADDLLARLSESAPTGLRATGGSVVRADDVGPEWSGLANELSAHLGEALTRRGWSPGEATVGFLRETKAGPVVAAPQAAGAGPHFLVFSRAGATSGVRPALIVAGAWQPSGLAALVQSLGDDARAPNVEAVFDGLVWSIGRRPTIAAARPDGAASRFAILVDPDRCTSCGLCTKVCPTGYLGAGGVAVTEDESQCLRCYDCVETCPQDALRPTTADDTATLSSTLGDRPGWLSRLRGQPGPLVPAPFPPSYLQPRESDEAPRRVLGLAIGTMQEHAAALVVDGEVVGAVEEERLNRERHYGWKPEGRAGVTICIDPRIALEEALCRLSVRTLLDREGLTLDDVDLFAINGVPARYRRSYSLVDGQKALTPLRAGRVQVLPHHLTHAASTFRASGFERAWVLCVDGRGDRETASLARAENGRIERVFDVLSLDVRSIGGVYEGVTRLLGLGDHGQGSTMALAAFGQPTFDFEPFLSVRTLDDLSIDEPGPAQAFASLARRADDPLTQAHKDLAASLQAALEKVLKQLLELGGVEGRADALCLAGGVALNCRANGELRRHFGFEQVFAQPGANDAGTALGAALEGWQLAHDAESVQPLSHAYLGPDFADEAIEAVLRRSGLRYRRVESIADEVAERLANGQVLGWFQGRMEFGPRALGGRSLLADPRDPTVKDRLNRVKSRQAWRPFAPSILAGHEADWFTEAFDARYMLFAVPVREDKQPLVPAIVHADGSTRPQAVHAETNPTYHAMISAFHARTGVPIVVNTSFNRQGEPIVCTPADAIACFGELEIDALAIGSFLVEKTPAETFVAEAMAPLPGGRTLVLDLARRPLHSARVGLAEGRNAGCDTLLLRGGSPTWLPTLVAEARALGYRTVTLESDGRWPSAPERVKALVDAGVTGFEVTVFAPDEALHDELAGARGAWRETMIALQTIARTDRRLAARLPLISPAAASLPRTLALVHRAGVRRVVFERGAPREERGRLETWPTLNLSQAVVWLRRATEAATRAGLEVRIEGFPLCVLPPPLRALAEQPQTTRLDGHEGVPAPRPAVPPPCRTCSARARCGGLSRGEEELFGTAALSPL